MMKMCLSSCLLLLFITGMCNASIAHKTESVGSLPSGGNQPGSGGSGGSGGGGHIAAVGGSSIATGPVKPPASGSIVNPPQHPSGPSSGSVVNGPSKTIISHPILSTGANGNGIMPSGPMSPSVMAHGPGPQCVPTVLFGLGPIFFNPNLTRTERNQQMDAWAAGQNASVQGIYNQFKANQTECIAEFNAALIHATVNLNASVQAVVAQLQAIFNNDSLTRMQIMQAVMPIFMNQTPAMKMALFQLRSSIHLNNTNCCMPPPGMEGMGTGMGMGGDGGPGMGGMFHSAEQDDSNGGDDNGNGNGQGNNGGNRNGNGYWNNGGNGNGNGNNSPGIN